MSAIRTTHVGSLPRPASLLTLLQRAEQDDVHPAQLAAAIESAVDHSVARQVASGLDIVNDGEMDKLLYATYVARRYHGFCAIGPDPAPPRLPDAERFPVWAEAFMANVRRPQRFVCDGPVAPRDLTSLTDELGRLKRAAQAHGAAQIFMNAPSPGIVAAYIENRYYPDRDAYFFALAEALRAEYEAIVESGATLQIDAPDLAATWAGEEDDDRDRRRHSIVAAINGATQGIAPERMRLHLCWGNYAGPHVNDRPLAEVFPYALRARPAAIVFEAANPRHEHEWRYFEKFRLPDDRTIVPGVIDNTNAFVEHPELVAQRIARYVGLVGAERVIAGVDCGFATYALNSFDEELAFAKLRSLVEGAALAAGG